MPSARRARRAPAQQRLDLAVPGNYLNNIEPDEMVRHLRVGSAVEYAAANMIERAIDAALAVQEECHGEAIHNLETDHEDVLSELHAKLNNLADDITFARSDLAQTHVTLIDTINIIQTLIDHPEHDFADAARIVRLAKEPTIIPKPKRVTRKARVPG